MEQRHLAARGCVDGRLQVNAADKADCDVSIHVLAALVYGTNDPDDFVFWGWGDSSMQIKQTMQSMFASMT